MRSAVILGASVKKRRTMTLKKNSAHLQFLLQSLLNPETFTWENGNLAERVLQYSRLGNPSAGHINNYSIRVHTKNCNHFSRTFQGLSRTTLDFQGQPTRNIISQVVQKCIFPVYSNKTLRL